MRLRRRAPSAPPTRWDRWRIARWVGAGLVLLLFVLPLLLAAAFLGIQEASERQWLGRAPQHAAIDVRSRQPHTVALMDVGFDSLAQRLRVIEGARESIELEFFIYELDEASRLITQALARKAAQGVKVRILVDFSLPVFKLAPHYARSLEAAGVQVRYYNTSGLARFFAMQHRTHRKLLVADQKVAIIGGRNIGNDYFDLSSRYNFLDSDLLIEGDIARAIVDSFELYWASDWVARPEDVADQGSEEAPDLLGQPSAREEQLLSELRAYPSQHQSSTCQDIQFVTDYPGAGVERRRVYPAIGALVREAREDVIVESPYLVLREDGMALARRVVGNGVKLRFLTNTLRSTDAFYAAATLADALEQYRVPGLEVWGYGGDPLAQSGRPPASERWGVHAKRAVFDDRTVVIGTYNMDPRSANLNSELIVICRDNTALASTMRASMQSRLAQSLPLMGTPDARGYEGVIEGADADAIFQMRMVTPIASFLDFLL